MHRERLQTRHIELGVDHAQVDVPAVGAGDFAYLPQRVLVRALAGAFDLLVVCVRHPQRAQGVQHGRLGGEFEVEVVHVAPSIAASWDSFVTNGSSAIR